MPHSCVPWYSFVPFMCLPQMFIVCMDTSFLYCLSIHLYHLCGYLVSLLPLYSFVPFVWLLHMFTTMVFVQFVWISHLFRPWYSFVSFVWLPHLSIALVFICTVCVNGCLLFIAFMHFCVNLSSVLPWYSFVWLNISIYCFGIHMYHLQEILSVLCVWVCLPLLSFIPVLWTDVSRLLPWYSIYIFSNHTLLFNSYMCKWMSLSFVFICFISEWLSLVYLPFYSICDRML